MFEAKSMFRRTRPDEYLTKMRTDWDARARANACHYIADGKADWNPDEFYKSGSVDVEGHILTDFAAGKTGLHESKH